MVVHWRIFRQHRALSAIICAENHLIVILGQAVISSQPRSSCGFNSLVPHMLLRADVYFVARTVMILVVVPPMVEYSNPTLV
jgi:hypothetical protein